MTPPSLGPPKNPPHDVLMLSSQLMFVVAGIVAKMNETRPPHGKKGQSYIPSLRIEFWIKSCKHSAHHLTLEDKASHATISFDLVREGMHESMDTGLSNFCKKKIFFSCWWMCMSSSFQICRRLIWWPPCLGPAQELGISERFLSLAKENGSKASHWIL